MNSTKEEIVSTGGLNDRSQQMAGKIAGSMFLFLIILYYAEMIIISQINAALTKSITEMSIDIIFSAATVLLAFTLYISLKPFNKKLAGIALFWRLGEVITGLIMMIFSLKGNAYIIGFNISAILFSISSLIFFYLFYTSGYIPRIMSVFGIFASVMVTIVGSATIVAPESSGVFQYGWIPMFITEITTGIWLLVNGLKTKPMAQPSPIQ